MQTAKQQTSVSCRTGSMVSGAAAVTLHAIPAPQVCLTWYALTDPRRHLEVADEPGRNGRRVFGARFTLDAFPRAALS
ncbi:MAG TPA: hypothetical protein VID73_13970 [Ktedonobacterales bacterium]|jgi:hypothetical protein